MANFPSGIVHSRRIVFVSALTGSLLLAVAAVWLENPLVFLIPGALLAIPILGFRLLTRPVAVLAVFLLLAVNLDIVKIGGTEISLQVAFSALLLWALLVRLGLEKRELLHTPTERAYVVFLLVTFVSVVLSMSVGRSLKNWFRDVEYLVLYSFLLGLTLTEKDRKMLAGAIVLSSLIPALAGLAGMLFDIPAFYGLETPIAGGRMIRRISGTLTHPVSLSLYLAMTATVTLSLLLDGRWFRRVYLFPMLVLELLVLYLTFGRTGWVVFLVSVIVLLVISGHRKWLWFGVPGFLAAVAISLPTFVARWETAWTTGGENSLLWRIGLWAYAITLIPKHWFFGSGQDTFIAYVAYGPGKASHQTWLGLAVETGIVGLVAFLIVVVVVARSLGRRMRRPEWRVDALVQATVAVFWGILVGSLAENPFKVPVLATLLWVLLAIAMNDRAVPGVLKAE